jgi:hypothetical protein
MSELVLFEQRQVRRVRHGDAWWFVIVDVVAVLTDSANPADYLKKLRKRDPSLSEAFKGGDKLSLPFRCALRRPAVRRSSNAGIRRAYCASSSPSRRPKPSRSSAGWRRLATSGCRRSRIPRSPSAA